MRRLILMIEAPGPAYVEMTADLAADAPALPLACYRHADMACVRAPDGPPPGCVVFHTDPLPAPVFEAGQRRLSGWAVASPEIESLTFRTGRETVTVGRAAMTPRPDVESPLAWPLPARQAGFAVDLAPGAPDGFQGLIVEAALADGSVASWPLVLPDWGPAATVTVPAGAPTAIRACLEHPRLLTEPDAGAEPVAPRENGVLIEGWAFAPDEPLTVAILVDGVRVGMARQGRRRDDVAEQFPGEPAAIDSGFAYFLDCSGLAPGPHTVTALLATPLHERPLAFPLQVERDPPAPIGVPAEADLRARAQGRVESCVGGAVRGWAIRPMFPDDPVEVEIRVDGVALCRARADRYRADLVRLGLASRSGGFECILPPLPDLRADAEIDVVFLPERLRLKGGPLPIRDVPPAAPGPALAWHGGEAPAPAAVIVPIHNAADDLRRCLASLLRHTAAPARLILIDDASTDPAIATILAGCEGLSNVEVLRNSENLGFTRTVNRGIAAAGRCDVVLLNSDAVVTPRWLDNLRAAAYGGRRVGTVTPFSDNAGAFSAPELDRPNLVPAWMGAEAHARAVTQVAVPFRPPVPTGNGFCLYVRRDCLDAIGVLDAEAFPRGYGEENDLCMRAHRVGWQHVIDDRTLVYHRRSASFGDEKPMLEAAGRTVIEDRYPEYRHLIRTFRSGPELLAARYRVRRLAQGADPQRRPGVPRILYVISTSTGGTPQTNEDLMRGMRPYAETWLLRCDARSLELRHMTDRGGDLVRSHRLTRPIELADHRSEEYDAVVTDWLQRHAIELVHVRHIAWHGLGLIAACRRLGIPVVFSFHDFYAVCPTVNLLDENQRFCGGRCTEGEGPCPVELWPEAAGLPLKHRWIHRWKAMLAAALADCDAFVTTADSGRRVVLDNHPQLADKPFHVIPHGRDLPEMRAPAPTLQLRQSLRVLVPGNIGVSKGADVIRALRDADRERLLEFHILGNAVHEVGGARIVRHGPYQRMEFARRAAAIGAQVGAIFSIWPETWCHTLTELWSIGLPVIAFDLGAVGERIRATGAGWLLPLDGPEATLRRIRRIVAADGEYESKVEAVRAWQESQAQRGGMLSEGGDVATMAARYRALYREVEERRRAYRRPGAPAPAARVGLMVIGDAARQQGPGSTHVRVWERTRPDLARTVEFEPLAVADCRKPDRLARLDAVLVQRDALPAWLAEPFIQACAAARRPFAVEIDDDLLALPPERDEDGRFGAAAPSLEALIRAAAAVVVSTPMLQRRMRRLNGNVALVPNALSARLWCTPLPPSTPRGAGAEFRILYMGTTTHAADLELVRGAMARLTAEMPHVRLHVVGGAADPADWYTPVPAPEGVRNYPDFVPWLRQLAQDMDLAIAPLVDTPFNRAKSDLKFLEYAACGLPGLYSDVPAYRDVVRAAGVGWLVRGTAQAWYKALREAVAAADALPRLGAAAQAWVRAHRLLDPERDGFDDLLCRLVRSPATEPAPNRSNPSARPRFRARIAV